MCRRFTHPTLLTCDQGLGLGLFWTFSAHLQLRAVLSVLKFLILSFFFICRPLGLARAETIYIHNPSQEVPVTLLSMFTTSRHFYIPFFHRRVSVPACCCLRLMLNIYSDGPWFALSLCVVLSQVIPPRGKASFKLIFLPSEEGNVENTLFINTSAHGLLSYQVSSADASPCAKAHL